MGEEKPRLARLTAIITQMQSKRLITARDIAEKHQVSIRTVYRDIRTLEKSGIPIITEEGRGYTIRKGYTLPPILFTEEEANAFITVEQIIANNSDESLIETFKLGMEKIKAVLKYSQKEKTELLSSRIQVRNYTKEVLTSQYLVKIQKCITEYLIAKIEYHSLKNKNTSREVQPFALIQTQQNWVLIAYCMLRNDFRTFRLDCITKLVLTGKTFPPHQITLDEFFEERKKIWDQRSLKNNP